LARATVIPTLNAGKISWAPEWLHARVEGELLLHVLNVCWEQ